MKFLTLLGCSFFMAITFLLAPAPIEWDMFLAIWACFYFALITMEKAQEK
jgi:hypothetical protein